MSQTIQKTIIALLAIAILGFFGYKIFMEVPDPATISAVGADGDTGIVGQDILTLVEKLRVVSIDRSIFSSALFLSLKDSGTTVTPEFVGRSNPFAPLGSGIGAAPVSTGPNR